MALLNLSLGQLINFMMTAKVSRDTIRRVVVIGGWGFTGSRFVLHLLKNTDYRVRVIDKNTQAADKSRVFDHISPDDRYRVEHFDLDTGSVSPLLLASSDYVVNFAGENHVDVKNLKKFTQILEGFVKDESKE